MTFPSVLPNVGTYVFVVMPDGELIEYGADAYENLDAAKRAMLKRAQQAWDADSASNRPHP